MRTLSRPVYINQQNEHVSTMLEAATEACSQLMQAGITVLTVDINHGQPTLWVENSQALAEFKGFKGFCFVREGANPRHWQGMVNQCRVHWRA